MPRAKIVLVAEHIPAPYEAYPHAPKVDAQILVEHAAFVAKCRGLWAELHSGSMTPDEFDNWVSRVPSFGCSCSRELQRYIADNPVDYDNFYAWGCKLHDHINRRLNKPLWDRVS